MGERIKDKDLECVNGGFDIGFEESDYDIFYKKDGEQEPDETIKPGDYTPAVSNNLRTKENLR